MSCMKISTPSWFPWIRVASAFLLLLLPFIAALLVADTPWGPPIALVATLVAEWKIALPLLANLTRARYIVESHGYPVGIGEAGPYAVTYIKAEALRDDAYRLLLGTLPLGWRTIIKSLHDGKSVYVLHRSFFLPLRHSVETARLLEALGFRIAYPEDTVVHVGDAAPAYTLYDKGVVVIEQHRREQARRAKLEFWKASIYPPGGRAARLLGLKPRHTAERILVELRLGAMLGIAKHQAARLHPQPAPERQARPKGSTVDARRIHVYAEEDIKSLLEAAEHNRERAFYALYTGDWNWACFHAHQAAELLIKAALAKLKGSYPETHRLEELLRELGRHAPRALRLVPVSRKLTVHYISARYPERARRRKITYNERTAENCVEHMEEIFEELSHLQR